MTRTMTTKISWPKCVVCKSHQVEVYTCPVCGVFACRDHIAVSPDGEHCEHTAEARSDDWNDSRLSKCEV